MNQRERMLSELPYKAWLDGLEEERKESRKRVYRYNNLPPEAEKEKDALIREIFGKTGETILWKRRFAVTMEPISEPAIISMPILTV